MKELDDKDFLLLDLLSKGSRRGTNAIARELKLHKNSVLYRIERLRKLGVISHFSFIPGILALGKNTFYVFFRLKLIKEDKDKTYDYLKNHPLSMMVLRLSGKWNIMMELVCSDINHFNDELAKITAFLGEQVIDYNTILLYIPYKVENTVNFKFDYAEKFIPNKAVIAMDSLDKELLGLISEDSSSPYGNIASKVGVSPDTVFYRLKKLGTSGIIRKFIPVVDLEKMGFQRYAVLLTFSGANDSVFGSIKNQILASKSVYFAFRTAGSLGIFLLCAYKSNSELDSFLTSISNSFGQFIKDQEVSLVSEVLSINYFPTGLRT